MGKQEDETVFLACRKLCVCVGYFWLSSTLSTAQKSPDSEEAQLIQSMLLYAVKGNWYPTTNKIMPYDEFTLKGGKLYYEVEDTPFTGWYAQYDQQNKPRLLCTFDDGKKNGFTYMWDENGTRRFQGEYQDNIQSGEFSEWNEFKQVLSQKNYLKGKLHGEYRLWYNSGRLKLEAYFQGGKLLDAQGWLPGGSPCPYSRVINGRGVILRHYERNRPDNKNSSKPSILREVLKELPAGSP